MPIQDRKLETGTRLVGTYKQEEYVCTVEADEDGKQAYVLADGRHFRSPSSAAGAVMGGKSVNGWLFWSRRAQELVVSTQAAAAKPAARGKKAIYKLPNQRGIAAGKSRWFCNACRKSFVQNGDQEPAACPEGHRSDVLELTSPPAGAAGAACGEKVEA